MHIGLIGGIGPAATDFYYRRLISTFASKNAALDLTIVHADTPTLLGNLASSNAAAQVAIYMRLIPIVRDIDSRSCRPRIVILGLDPRIGRYRVGRHRRDTVPASSDPGVEPQDDGCEGASLFWAAGIIPSHWCALGPAQRSRWSSLSLARL